MLRKTGIYLKMMLAVLMFSGCTAIKNDLPDSEEIYTASPEKSVREEQYRLEKLVILGRHHLRSPLSSGEPGIDEMCIFPWYKWTSAPGELSEKGELLETEMGKYFHEWTGQEGMQLNRDNIYVYANSMQRTIRTAECFLDGFMPGMNIPVETQSAYGTMDPVFMPSLKYYSTSYDIAAQDAFSKMKETDLRCRHLQEDYELLCDVTGYEKTEGFQKGSLPGLDAENTELVLYPDIPPAVEGSLKSACRLADALLLQYYEETDPRKAGFGRILDKEQWKQIAEIRELYNDTQYSQELIASSAAHPLLEMLEEEMQNPDHAVSLICGHDANITSVLSALGVCGYELPDTPEAHTPTGGKLVMEVWTDSGGNRYVRMEMIYQNAEQIRNASELSLENPPEIYELCFQGIKKNEDGLYPFKIWMERMDQSVGRLDQIRKEYR